jgi:hypothetical protein
MIKALYSPLAALARKQQGYAFQILKTSPAHKTPLTRDFSPGKKGG